MPHANLAAHILVVDDDPSLRRLLQQFLSARGYAVSTAENGQMALTIVSEQRPDLVISDIEMPRLNGVELMQALHVQHPSLPILLVSAHDPVAFPDVPVLAKPFRLVQLLHAVRTLLTEASTTRA